MSSESNHRDVESMALAHVWPDVLVQHAPWLRTVVFTRLGEAQAVDDVMQEIGLAISKMFARPRGNLEMPRSWEPWLYRVAVRQALLYRRRVGRQRRLVAAFSHVAEQRQACEAADTLAWLLADERAALIRAAVRELPPRDAQLLLLKYAEGWSYHQIAERLGITPKAVETRLARARAKLRAKLSPVLDPVNT